MVDKDDKLKITAIAKSELWVQHNMNKIENSPDLAAQWLTRIEAMHPSEIDLGLDRMAIVAERLGLQPDPLAHASAMEASTAEKSLLSHKKNRESEQAVLHRHIITVAGTNGKGSTVRAVEALCLRAGITCAAYTSPHLADFGERLRFNGVSTKGTDWVPFFEKVEAARMGQGLLQGAEREGLEGEKSHSEIALTFFEFTTLAAFLMLTESTAQVWIMEIGLGGRLDAVNWLNPTVAVVTRIAQDHEQWLGVALPDIAREKCGIFRENRPALWADADADEAVVASVKAMAQTRSVSQLYDAAHFGYRSEAGALQFYGRDVNGQAWCWSTDIEVGEFVATGLETLGRLHPAAWAAALQAFALIAADWADMYTRVWPQCWQQARLPGRFEVKAGEGHGPQSWIYDVAHNMDALLLLTDKLKAAQAQAGFDRVVCVFGVMADKPWQEMMRHLLPFVSRWILVAPETPRSVATEDLFSEIKKQLSDAQKAEAEVIILRGPQTTWKRQVSATAKSGEVVLVCGSFFTVGPFYVTGHLSE